MIPADGEQTFLLQFGQFYRHCGALYTEIICQLLPVIGNDKRGTALSDRFCGKIGQQLVPGFPPAHVRDFFVEHQIFLRQYRDQIPNQLIMMRACTWTNDQKLLHAQQQHAAVFFRRNAYIQHKSFAITFRCPQKSSWTIIAVPDKSSPI